jgi:hypothetical protein
VGKAKPMTIWGEILFGLFASLSLALLIGGWGLFSKDSKDKAASKKLVIWIFSCVFVVYLYNSDFWKSDLWK